MIKKCDNYYAKRGDLIVTDFDYGRIKYLLFLAELTKPKEELYYDCSEQGLSWMKYTPWSFFSFEKNYIVTEK